MTSKKYECDECNYKTNIKYNFNRHMMLKHENIDNKKTVENDNKNTVVNKKTVENNNKCEKCLKSLSSKQYLQKHLLICKGIANPLECQYCHKILCDSSSKTKHLKVCKKRENKEEDNEEEEKPQIITNQTINNNCVTNNITNTSNIIYNINLVSFNKHDEKITFDTSHLNKDFMYKIRTKSEDDAFYYYCNILFENENNKMIIKSSMRNDLSNVHVGLNVWEKIYDDYIYHHIMCHISESLLLYMSYNCNMTDKYIQKYRDYLDYMCDKGYSTTNPSYWKSIYKNNIKKLKNLFYTFKKPQILDINP